MDFGLLARRLGQDLANQFVNAVIDKFLFQPLLNGLSDLFGLQVFNNVALEANTATLTTLTAAISASGDVGAGVAAASVGTAGGGAIGGSVSAASHIGGFGIGRWRFLQALPGSTQGTRFRRSSGPASTSPRPRWSSVPGLFYALEKLRRGVHGLPNFGSLRNAPKGFATGGPVDGTLRTANQLAGSNQGPTVLPVLVTDERSMKRIHEQPSIRGGYQ